MFVSVIRPSDLGDLRGTKEPSFVNLYLHAIVTDKSIRLDPKTSLLDHLHGLELACSRFFVS